MRSGPRTDNAVDFWRGLALVMIFIDHIPGNIFSYATLRNFAISDAAELFVFLAGWSLSRATGGPATPEPGGRITFRLLSRAVEIYRAQIVISAIALAMLSAMAITRGNPLFLEWHNASVAFYDPVRASLGSAMLTYQLSYFNILPLYVVLLVLAAPFIVLGRLSIAAMLAASMGLYLAAIITHTAPPSWPTPGAWYFNPLCWQVLFFSGFAAAEMHAKQPGFAIAARRWVPFAGGLVLLGLVIRLIDFWPDPLYVPEPRLLFLFDKSFLSPARLISVFALVVAFHTVFDRLKVPLRVVSQRLCALGRNSLAVFSVASLAALGGQIARFSTEGGVAIDILMVGSGLVVMGLTAWFVEWRVRAPSSSRAS